MADPVSPFAGFTSQDQKLIMGALKSLKNGFEVDYSRLAENMDWFMKDDATKPNTRKANNAWLGTRKKLFPDGFPASVTSDAGAAKAKVPIAPRKKKEQEVPKTPRAKKKAAKEGREQVENDDEGAHGSESDQSATPEGPKGSERPTQETGEANVKEPHEISTTHRNVADAEDTTMNDASIEETIEDNPITAVTGASVADEMSAGSMSPPPTPTITKGSPRTPKGKSAPKNNKVTVAGSSAKAATVPLPVTPATPTPKVTPMKRKTKAEKEAEATDADGQNDAADHTDQTPPAKKRKSIDGKAVFKNQDKDDATDAGSDAGESAKPTPVKTPRRPSEAVLAKKKEKEEEKAAKKAEKEKEKADKKAEKEREKEREKAEKKAEKEREKEREKAAKKAEKEREKSEKQAARKGAQKSATEADSSGAESPKPTPRRKPATATPAKTIEKGETNKAKKEPEDKAAAEADSARIALAAQEEINKQANEVFGGARIDKPVSSTTADDDENEDSVAVADIQLPVANGFIAINSNGAGSHASSDIAVVESAQATVEEADDGDTIVVAQETTIAVEVSVEDDATAVGRDA